MYLKYFGLRELPFSLVPAARYFVPLADQSTVVDRVRRALDARDALVKVTGESGIGKTIISQYLQAYLSPRMVLVVMPDLLVSNRGFMRSLAEGLGVDTAQDLSDDELCLELLSGIDKLKDAGKDIVLLVDEAQCLSGSMLETLSRLAGLARGAEPLLQMVLLGQPGLDEILETLPGRQLKSRISDSVQVGPLSEGCLRSYINQRLAHAGFRGVDLFEPDAVRRVYQASRGIPRVINLLCHKALCAAYRRSEVLIRQDHVQQADEELGLTLAATPPSELRSRGRGIFLLVLAVVVSSGITLAFIQLIDG